MHCSVTSCCTDGMCAVEMDIKLNLLRQQRNRENAFEFALTGEQGEITNSVCLI